MPLTAKGEKILAAMQEEYGEEEGKRIFYASKNAGRISGVDARRRRRGISRDPYGRETGSWEEEEDAMPLLPLVVVSDAARPLLMHDAVDLDDARLETTADGYLKAMPRIARTGIQLYCGDECGRPDVETVRVYRPEDSVFANAATHSYTHLPITIEHPGGAVDSSNWRKHAVGETGDEVLRDGNTVRVPMMLRDAEAIRLVRDGKRELSVGYACDIEWGKGITPDGEEYDAVQRNIRGNHLAIVSRARGGPSLRIGDQAMDLKTVLIDGLPCQMSDKDAAIVQKTIGALQDELADQSENFEKFKKKKKEEEDSAAKVLAQRDEDIKTKDALIATLQKQLKDATDPAAEDEKLAARDAVRARARALMGDSFKVDGKKIEDVRREVVIAKSGVPEAKGWGDAEIKAVFDHLTAGVQQQPHNPINDARFAFAGGDAASGTQAKVAAYNEMVKDMENAWRKPAA